MRIFTGGLHHESDSFNPRLTGWSDISIRRGVELLERRGGEDAINGMATTLEASGHDVILGLHARAIPGGEWEPGVFDSLCDELISMLQEALPVDGICLALHGSLRVHGRGRGEDILLTRIRALCPGIPVVACLDPHSSWSDCLELCDAVVAYKESPHVDAWQTGTEAASLLLELLSGTKLHMAVCPIPMLVAGEKSGTGTEPMRSLSQLSRDLEGGPVASTSYLLGYPWSSEPGGCAAIAVSRQGMENAMRVSQRLASSFWTRRHDFSFCSEAYDEATSIQKALGYINDGQWPVVLSDSGDNPTAGSSQDVPVLLRQMLLNGSCGGAVYQAFNDPASCTAAFEAGEGATVRLSLGACYDKRFEPLDTVGHVISLVRGFETEGWRTDLARVDIEGIDVIITSSRCGCYDPDMMRAVGIEPSGRKLVVVKLGYLEPALAQVARRSILVLTPGATDEVLERIPYPEEPKLFPLTASLV